MALQTTITAESPDRTEYKYDRTVKNRGYWEPGESEGTFVYVYQGYFIETTIHTIKTWYACTQAACITFAEAYEGGGSIDMQLVSEVLNAYNFVLTETEKTEEWNDAPEEE
jgi:hypothetical protein